jgi:hypothetical protein
MWWQRYDCTAYPQYFSTFINRIRGSRQDAAAPAGLHRLKPGLQDIPYPDYFSTFINRDSRTSDRATYDCTAYPQYFSTFINRIRGSRQECRGSGRPSPAKAGTPGYSISRLFLNLHKPGLPHT